jgi:hypothetical protein
MNGVFYFTAERIKEIEEKYVELVTNLSLYFKDYDDIERICAKKGINLAKRMLAFKENHLLFLHDFSVPFGNNDAERPLRHFKLKKNVMGSSRSIKGAEVLVNNMTTIKSEYFKSSNISEFILDSFIGKKLQMLEVAE